MTLHTTESGLSCSNSQTALSLSSASTFWARYCETGEITLRVQDAANTANGTTYTVNIGSPPALLALEDLDDTGLSFEVAALIEAGGTGIVYAASPYSAAGTLVAGDLSLFTGNEVPITRIQFRNTAQTGPGGDTITLNDSSALALGPYLGTGVGSDLTMYIQTTADNVVSWTVASSFERGGGNYAHFTVPSEHRSMVAGISAGERFIFALGRSAVPAFASDSVTRAVDENALINTEVGVPVTAVDPQGATLTYSISGDSAFSINSATGQILTAVATLDYEEATSHVVTVTATSSGGSDTIMVTININDLDDGLRLTPDPEGQHWHVGDEQEFTSGNTPGVESVRVMQMSLTGHLTLRSQSGGTSCASSVNILNLASDASFWALFCTAGTVTLRMEDLNDDTNFREWTVTITEVSASAPALVFVVYVDEGNGYIDLSWPLVGDGGSPITHYEYSSDGGTTWRSTGSTDRSYQATQTSAATPADLENGTAYSWRVRAVNAIGAGAASPAVSATPQAPTVPDAPTGLTATGGNNQVVLSWTEPSDNDSPITHYEFSRDGGTTWHSTGSTALTYTDTDVTNGVEYDYQVRAVNVLGEGEASTTVDESPYGPPTAPRDLQGVPGDGSVTLSWTAPENDGGGAGITGYEYQVDSNGYVATGSTSLSHEVTGLTNGQEYAFRVRAQSNFGGGFPAGPESFTPTSNTVPGVPTNLTATPGDEFVDLDWTAPADDGGTPIIRYEWATTHPFAGFSAADGWEDTGSLETNFRATRKTNTAQDAFVNGTEYCFSIRAVNSEGPGVGPLTFCATPANQPPSFVSPAVFRSVDENLLAGANVGNPITATDPESDTIVYSITGSNPGGFTVNSSGQIQTGQVLNREETVSYTITLRAQATGGHDTTEVTIQVTDVNEAPAFGQDSYSRSVDENVSNGTNLGGPITAVDPDGDTLTYTLSGTGASSFNVTGSGQIETAGTINYEAASSYTLTLTASDGTLSDTATINITVNNLPEDAGLTGLAAPSAGLGRTTARLEATLNNQDGLTTTVYFRYRTPPSGGSWTSAGSDSTTGTALEVTLSGLTPGTQYRAQASLSSSFPSSGRQQVDFSTTTNAGPVFSPSPATRRIDENRPEGTNVGAPVTATDADDDTLTYTLSGTDAADFALDSASGQLTVGTGTVLDFEATASYSVTVTATDTHSATASVVVTIEVQDLREAGVLGRIVISVGRSGMDYGYDSGSFGILDSGDFPGALFDDGNDRNVAEIYEDGNGAWYFTYSGGAANDWLSDADALNEILVSVDYDDGLDQREFVLGGFIDSRPRVPGAEALPAAAHDAGLGRTHRRGGGAGVPPPPQPGPAHRPAGGPGHPNRHHREHRVAADPDSGRRGDHPTADYDDCFLRRGVRQDLCPGQEQERREGRRAIAGNGRRRAGHHALGAGRLRLWFIHPVHGDCAADGGFGLPVPAGHQAGEVERCCKPFMCLPCCTWALSSSASPRCIWAAAS